MTTRILLVGFGGFGQVHAEQIRAAEGCELVGVCDPQLPSQLPDGVRGWQNLDEALAESECDLVSVATPTPSHASIAEVVIRAGKPLLLEKPVAADLDTAMKVADLEKRYEGWCDVVSQRRFQVSAAALKRIVESGELGIIASVNCVTAVWRSAEYFASPWHGLKEQGGGNLLNHGMHAVDLLVWLFGSPTAFAGLQTPTRFSGSDIDETCVGIVQFPSGPLGVVEATLAASPFEFRIEVRGSEATAVLRNESLTLQRLNADALHWESVDTDKALGAQYAEAARRLQAGLPPSVGLNEAIEALRLALSLSTPHLKH